MLSFLRIKDFALIKSLELELGPGLTIITGETGAGKSIILAALGLILGQRATNGLIRENSESALVEALFDLDKSNPVFDELGNENGNHELVISRIVNQQGRNRVQVNGSLANLSLLNKLAPFLVNICGQHAHQTLLKPEEHLLILDAFGNLDKKRDKVKDCFFKVKALDQKIAQQQKALDEREIRRDYLLHQISEIEQANLDPKEEEELKQERKFLGNAEKIMSLGQKANYELYSAEKNSGLEILGKVKAKLLELAHLDERTKQIATQVEEAFYQIEDAAHILRDYIFGLNFDPARLNWVESRLTQLQRLTRKYGGDVKSALKALERAKNELTDLEKGDQSLLELKEQREKALAQALKQAENLSDLRKNAAKELNKAVETELQELGMTTCRFEVRFESPNGSSVTTALGPIGPRGLEEAEFYIAPNPGEGFRALARIASGGELSRILLALQALNAHKKGASVQIYDEVDTGIGGVIGASVGRKLANLSKNRQVICITHLPQIAAWADRHFVVKKSIHQGRTSTTLAKLDSRQQADELARMLAGTGDITAAKEHARKMLEAVLAEKQKNQPSL